MSSREIMIFIACSDGKSTEFETLIKDILNTKEGNTQLISPIFVNGNIPWNEVAETADQCIGAVVIASDDEQATQADRNRDHPVNAHRSNDNTWVELGWLLARFSLERVIVLKHSLVQLPERIRGIDYIGYDTSSTKQKLEEALNKISSWIDETKPNGRSRKRLEVPEVLSVFHSSRAHFSDWENMRTKAVKNLVITGISMSNIQGNLQSVFNDTVVRNNQLRVDFIVLDPNYAESHKEMLESAHRKNAVENNRSFFTKLYHTWSCLEPDQQERVSLYLLNNFIPAFAAHVVDGAEPGGLILFQVLIPKNSSISAEITDYPRLLLIRRSGDGTFNRISESIHVIQSQSKKYNIGSIPQLLGEDI